RMDCATPANARIALEKAETAALSRRSSKSWEDRVAGGRLSMLKMPILPVQGGVPVVFDAYCIGAVGVSGVQSHEDEQIAEAGIREWMSGLN
ncbi:MAG: GlcG/HbpS family heme-binding protein, partial [bacterium]